MERPAHGEFAPEIAASDAVYLHRFLFRFALAALNTFSWIFVFREFFLTNHSMALSIAGVAALYALSQGVVIILTPLTGAFLRRGIRRILGYSIVCAALSYALLALTFIALDGTNDHVFSAIASFTILQGMFRALYWLPYRVGASHTRMDGSSTTMLREAAIAAAPAMAGILLGSTLSFAPILLLSGALIMLLSILPVIVMPEQHERYRWDYNQTFRQLFSFAHRPKLRSAIYDGAQGAGLLIVWPLAAFIVLDWSFATLGLVITLSIFLSIIFRRLMQSLLEMLNVEKSRHVAATLAFSAWILRLGAGTPVSIMLVESFYTSATRPTRFGIDAHGRDQVADLAHYVDEETALKEMGHAIGRIIMCLILGLSALMFSDATAFVLTLVAAGAAAALSVLAQQRGRHDIF